jgi:hypothetical protein
LSYEVNRSTPPASVSYVSFDLNTWPGGFAGLAVNEAPTTEPMAAPALAGLISHANRANNNRNTGGFGKPFVVHEFNLYDSKVVRMGGALNRPARITMSYNDANGDGVVDETEGTPTPVKVAALGVYWLDEDTGVWVRLPTSRVDTVARTVTAQIVHFSVYGLLGAPELSLANAYAYPVPYKPSVHKNGIRFKNLSSIGTIKIYTVNGELVNTLQVPNVGGNLTWNPVANSAGDPLASGVYIYVIENPQEKKTGKIMVVR